MRALLATLAALTGLALVVLVAARPAGAVPDYTAATKQPCVACHTSSSSGELNERGRAFAAVETHKTDPAGAWAKVEAEMPATPTPAAGASAPPAALIGLVALVVVGAVAVPVLRRGRR